VILTVANSKYYGCFNSIMFLCGKQSNETVTVHPVKTLLSVHIKITVCLWSPVLAVHKHVSWVGRYLRWCVSAHFRRYRW